MRAKIRLSYGTDSVDSERQRLLLFGLRQDSIDIRQAGVVAIELPYAQVQDNQYAEAVCAWLSARGIDYHRVVTAKYAKTDLLNANGVMLSINERRWINVERSDLQINFDKTEGCSRCGSGAVLFRYVRIKERKIQKQDGIVALSEDIVLVDRNTRAILDKESFSGVTFVPVCNFDDKPLDWFALQPEHELPRMTAQTRGLVRGEYWKGSDGLIREGPCPQCDKNCHFQTASELPVPTYDYSSIKKKLEAWNIAINGLWCLRTWECFGHTIRDSRTQSIVRLPQPMLVVSPRFFELLFIKLDKKFVCTPVEFINCND
jgi:hypothetical protein